MGGKDRSLPLKNISQVLLVRKGKDLGGRGMMHGTNIA